jgi:hypothetical protein
MMIDIAADIFQVVMFTTFTSICMSKSKNRLKTGLEVTGTNALLAVCGTLQFSKWRGWIDSTQENGLVLKHTFRDGSTFFDLKLSLPDSYQH